VQYPNHRGVHEIVNRYKRETNTMLNYKQTSVQYYNRKHSDMSQLPNSMIQAYVQFICKKSPDPEKIRSKGKVLRTERVQAALAKGDEIPVQRKNTM